MRRVLLTSLLFAQICEAKLVKHDDGARRFVKVAIIDTGIDPVMLNSKEYCKTGHKDFTGAGIKDDHGHGTHISGIVDQYAKGFALVKDGTPKQLKDKSANYCQIIIKYYDSKGSDVNNLFNTIKALRWAIDQKVDIINYSGGGVAPYEEEKKLIIEALDKGIKVVAAAGNERSDLEIRPYYPAMYDKRIYIVGNLVSDKSREIASSSNFGKPVNTWEVGTNVLSTLPNGLFGRMSGSSQATAVKSGKLVKEMLQAE